MEPGIPSLPMSCRSPDRARTRCSADVMPSWRPMRTHRRPTRPLCARISRSEMCTMRARPGLYWDAPDSGLGITIANRYPLWLLVAIQTTNAAVERVGRLIGAQMAGHQRGAGGLNRDPQRECLDAGPFELGRRDRHHPAAGVDNRPAAVAWADGRGELNVVAPLQASESRDHPDGHGAAQPQGRADHHNGLGQEGPRGSGPQDGENLAHMDDGQVVVGIHSRDRPFEAPIALADVDCDDARVPRIGDDVEVRHQLRPALAGAGDPAGPEAVFRLDG